MAKNLKDYIMAMSPEQQGRIKKRTNELIEEVINYGCLPAGSCFFSRSHALSGNEKKIKINRG
ncbi:hypothetical protein GMMP15_580025 [Candidatus Magnetomoraceae bacterium gMMP-15]